MAQTGGLISFQPERHCLGTAVPLTTLSVLVILPIRDTITHRGISTSGTFEGGRHRVAVSFDERAIHGCLPQRELLYRTDTEVNTSFRVLSEELVTLSLRETSSTFLSLNQLAVFPQVLNVDRRCGKTLAQNSKKKNYHEAFLKTQLLLSRCL